MRETIKVENFPLYFAARISRALEFQQGRIRVSGCHSPLGLALLLTQGQTSKVGTRPQVVIMAEHSDVEQFRDTILSVDPQVPVYVLPPFDVGVYSTLYPNHKVIANRIQFLHKALNAKPGEIFVASVEAIMQKTLPATKLNKATLTLRKNDTLPDHFAEEMGKFGYVSTPTVEDVGTFAFRGGILDIYSPAEPYPYRIELFGDIVESIRVFDPSSQRSLHEVTSATILPAREAYYEDERRQKIAQLFQNSIADRPVEKEDSREILRAISQGQYFYGMDFLLPYFFDHLEGPLEFFNTAVNYWLFDPVELTRKSDEILAQLKDQFKDSESQTIRPGFNELYTSFEQLQKPLDIKEIEVERILIETSTEEAGEEALEFKSLPLNEFANACAGFQRDQEQLIQYLRDKLSGWREQGYRIFISAHSVHLAQRLQLLLEKAHLRSRIVGQDEYLWSQWLDEQETHRDIIHIIPRALTDSGRWSEEFVIFLRDSDIWGRKRGRSHRVEAPSGSDGDDRVNAISFGDLKPGDLVVHRIHGIGEYEGLEVMQIEGVPAEFIRLKYKDGDKLFLPVYRVGQLQRYSGPSHAHLLDKLGGPGWGKTKTKVKSHLRDIADGLLKLYAKRAQIKRPPFSPPDDDFAAFESTFPYEETEDQLRAIEDVLNDMMKDRPMDRLICGDVGFGKTEVAMRATFKAVQDRKQVAIVAPTTILTFQHYENFKKRFAKWPVEIRALNRFVPPKEVKKTIADLKEGKVDIVVGTHRLLSKDVGFKNLGLLIIDEEQKFGVTHKERIRQLRESVDTLTMSATPIPRTLNMSLVGIRDLSLINTPPEERLPTRTFVCKYDLEILKKGIQSELSRGGQVFFLHNRVQTIHEAASKVREAVPHARIAVAHGQMDEDELEKTMLAFFNHELDVLVCTAIIESGIDISRANTIFIDNAHTFGVSQLYQLRGRVGRSQDRAYCYLLIPPDKRLDKDAQERVRIIQENTALGSGLRVAQYDLELRGAGDILGESQSGHINAVGYELYLELLEDAIREQRGEEPKADALEPEINLRIPALIPDSYIPDIRLRLSYYKALSQVRGPEDLDRIEDELKDQYGPPPEPVINLMGLMLIRKHCRDLGVKDISSSKVALTLAFTERTPLPPAEVIKLTARDNKKYQLTPDQKLKIRMNEITWPRVNEELEYLLSLCPPQALL